MFNETARRTQQSGKPATFPQTPAPGRPNKIGQNLLADSAAPMNDNPLAGAMNAFKSAASAQRKGMLGA